MATVCHPATGQVTASFAAVAKHYGVSVAICPPRRGNRKGVVEKANHEVVVATINSTRTRTGLRCTPNWTRAPTRWASRSPSSNFGQLPIQPTPGTGSGTTPSPHRRQSTARSTPRASPRPGRRTPPLADQRLTGMSRAELAALAEQLAPAQEAQAAQRRFEQRGGPRRRAPRRRQHRLLTAADRVLITIVYQRQICSQNVLCDLLGISEPIGLAISETRQLLQRTPPTSARRRYGSTPLRELRDYVDSEPSPSRSDRECPTCSPIPH